MKKYLKLIEERNFKSSDVESLIQRIQDIIKNKESGHQELSNDDIKQLKIIEFFLKEYEKHKENIGFSSNENALSHHKVRNIINDLEMNGIVTYVIQAMGGHFSFKITDKVRFRNFLYESAKEIIEKIPLKENLHDKVKKLNLKKIDWKNPWIVTIVGGLVVGIILLAIASNSGGEPPNIEFDFVDFNPTFFSCDYDYDFNITYKVAHISGEPVGFGQPYYKFINQTKNTCLNDFTFFNSSGISHALCSNTFYEDNQVVGEACNPELEPINQKTVKIVSDQSQLVSRMKTLFRENNVSSCEINEEIILCISLDEEEYCDNRISTLKLNYNCYL